MLLPTIEERCDRFDGSLSPPFGRDLEPDKSRVLAQPGFLVPDVAMRVEADAFDRCVEGDRAVEVRQELPVTDAGHACGRCGHTSRKQLLNLLDKSAADLAVNAAVNDLEKFVAWPEQADLQGVKGSRSLAFLRRHGNARGFIYFQRTYCATQIISAPLCA